MVWFAWMACLLRRSHDQNGLCVFPSRMGTPIHEKPQVFVPSDGLHARLCGHAYCSVKLIVALRASKHTSRTVVDGQAASGELSSSRFGRSLPGEVGRQGTNGSTATDCTETDGRSRLSHRIGGLPFIFLTLPLSSRVMRSDPYEVAPPDPLGCAPFIRLSPVRGRLAFRPGQLD